MISKYLALIGAALLWSTAANAQIEAVNLQPQGDWEVEQLSDRCIFTRTFGDPASPTTLELHTIDPWNFGFQTVMTSRQYTLTEQPFRAIWLPGGSVSEVDSFSIVEGADGARGLLASIGMRDASMNSRVVGRDGPFDVLEADPDYDFDEEPQRFRENIKGLLVVDAFDSPIFLATGSMHETWSQRSSCIDRVLVSQGVDPADADRSDHRVEMTNSGQLTERVIRALPRDMRRRERPTNVTFLLYVNAEAQPQSCRLTSIPYDEEYERRSCEVLMDRADFRFKDGETPQPTFFKASGFFIP